MPDQNNYGENLQEALHNLLMEEKTNPQLVVTFVVIFLSITFISRLFKKSIQKRLEASKNKLPPAQRKAEKIKPPHLIINPLPLEINFHVGEGKYNFKTFSFCTHKNGGNESENEDRYAISSHDSSCLRIAVADGTTEGLYSDVWAGLLVDSYCDKGAELFEDSILWTIHKEFIDQTYNKIAQMPENRHWAMYEKLERGTNATLAAIEFSNRNTVKMSAVGDSCIFWVDTDKVEMFPELSVDDFGISPDLICHVPETWPNLSQKIRKKEISLDRDRKLVVCTDALAHWLVKETSENNNFLAWEKICSLSDIEAFNQLIEELRETKEIRNDDVTLVIIDATPFPLRVL
jgi:hypothetical protein